MRAGRRRMFFGLALAVAFTARPVIAQDGVLQPPETIRANLTSADPIDPRTGKPGKRFSVRFSGEKSYVISVTAGEDQSVDPQLRLEDARGAEVTRQPRTISRRSLEILFHPKADGVYQVIVSTMDRPGAFVLTIHEHREPGLLAPYLDRALVWLSSQAGPESYLGYPFIVMAGLAVLLVGLACGAIGSLVVGNRMAFFSDALAHCAFAGVALGILLALFSGRQLSEIRESRYFLTLMMVLFGILFGVAIAFVREKTALSHDTVIGVFFAGAMGLGAMLLKAVTSRGYFNLENFLFGGPETVTAADLEWLLGLLLLTGLFLAFLYNDSVFASFNLSLARSRGIRVRLCQYLFIMLLGVLVNVSIQIVGVLLINALLIVPAATAANLSRNMRQFFWFSVLIALGVGFFGYWLSLEIRIPDPPRQDPLRFGVSGTIVVLSVLAFIASMLLGPRIRKQKPAPA